MNHYVGIDLGTTNTAIATYDGTRCQVRKSTTHMEDATPSAIYHGRRGKFVGRKAYANSFMGRGRATLEFKRFLGTSTRIELPDANMSLTPEECSAEILRTVWNYLPDDMRQAKPGTVITVPAAFNQMQKNGTLEAAEMAGLGQIALLQEPVAAVMSVLHHGAIDGMFMIYDLGGGTLDIAIAEAHGGHVNLLAHGGIQHHGGKDWDRAIVHNVVWPWLMDQYNLPEDVLKLEQYKQLVPAITRRAEEAKIALSAQMEIGLEPFEGELGYTEIQDSDGEVIELYDDLRLTRKKLWDLISEKVDASVKAARQTLKEAGVTSDDMEKIVFIGGPTNYGPLRETICYELGIQGSTEVNPMTAVAEGAAIYAESVDWEKDSSERKSERGTTSTRGPLKVELAYTKRVADEHGQVRTKVTEGTGEGATVEVTSEETGWSSGQVPVGQEQGIRVPLPKWGDNRFVVEIRGSDGNRVEVQESTITITRTAATVEGIPASHSIGLEVQDRVGGATIVDRLVHKGDTLPTKGTRTYRAAIRVRNGSTDQLLFKLSEGEADESKYNRPIGALKITGTDFDDGQIEKGAELECSYSMDSGGTLKVRVEVPSIESSFGEEHNFYAPQEGQIDLHGDRDRIKDEAEAALQEATKLYEQVQDNELLAVIKKLGHCTEQVTDEAELDDIQEAREATLEAQTTIGNVRQANRPQTRQVDLDGTVEIFDGRLRNLATPARQRQVDTLIRTAQEAIEEDDADFEKQHEELQQLVFQLFWEDDGFVLVAFNWRCQKPDMFRDKQQFWRLAAEGKKAVDRGDIDHVRNRIIPAMDRIRYEQSRREDLAEAANILKG